MTKFNNIILAAVTVLGVACEKSTQPSATVRAEGTPAVTSSQPAAPSPATAATSLPAGPLTPVTDRSLVCMVNNQFMGRPQIPVTVGANTYYGCCEMCKGRLANDPASRAAVDPVSQRPVDKAIAIIGRAENGTVVYFENEQNFAAYVRQARAN